jgi:hypothetical protein
LLIGFHFRKDVSLQLFMSIFSTHSPQQRILKEF